MLPVTLAIVSHSFLIFDARELDSYVPNPWLHLRPFLSCIYKSNRVGGEKREKRGRDTRRAYIVHAARRTPNRAGDMRAALLGKTNVFITKNQEARRNLGPSACASRPRSSRGEGEGSDGKYPYWGREGEEGRLEIEGTPQSPRPPP